MRSPLDVFHLAIPVRDLDDARRFYVKDLGCTLARRYADRITLTFSATKSSVTSPTASRPLPRSTPGTSGSHSGALVGTNRTRSYAVEGRSPGSSQIGAGRLGRGVCEPVVQQRGALPDDIAGLDGAGLHDRAASGGRGPGGQPEIIGHRTSP